MEIDDTDLLLSLLPATDQRRSRGKQREAVRGEERQCERRWEGMAEAPKVFRP